VDYLSTGIREETLLVAIAFAATASEATLAR
jgi:hypothetical protein